LSTRTVTRTAAQNQVGQKCRYAGILDHAIIGFFQRNRFQRRRFMNLQEMTKDRLVAYATELRQELAESKQSEAGLRQIAESLREEEVRYRDFFDTSRDSVFITTLEGKFIDINDAALDTLGYDLADRDSVMQREVVSFYMNPADRYEHTMLISKPGFSKEYPADLLKKDGSIIHVLITTVPRRDSRGAVIGFQGTIRDVTELKRSEETLRTTVQRFYTILSSLYSGVLIVTEDGRVEFANQAFCDMFDLDDAPDDLKGLTAADMIGKIQDVYADAACSLARIEEIVATQQPIKGEEIAIRGDRTYTRDFIPIFVDGKRCGRLWHHTDITERKRTEKEKEKLAADLTEALAQVKKLSGFLPICASCKRIRDDQGYWRQVEDYIRDHSEAEFSHGICPTCVEKLYPGFGKKVPADTERGEKS
jgi:PAS domain S-box-containing protein